MDGIPVTWGDLIRIVLFLLGAGALFYLILAIANLVGILSNLNKMLSKNRANINSTLEKLPEITDNVAKVSNIVKDEMESIQKVMGNIGKISDSAKDAAEMIRKDILVKAKSLLDIIDWIRKLFQDKSGRKKNIVYKYKYRQKPSDQTVVEEVISTEPVEERENESQPAEGTKENAAGATEGESEQGEGK